MSLIWLCWTRRNVCQVAGLQQVLTDGSQKGVLHNQGSEEIDLEAPAPPTLRAALAPSPPRLTGSAASNAGRSPGPPSPSAGRTC